MEKEKTEKEKFGFGVDLHGLLNDMPEYQNSELRFPTEGLKLRGRFLDDGLWVAIYKNEVQVGSVRWNLPL